ncbi:peptidase C2, partial [Frankia sp. CNm7]|uniref:C2 family cysteine protease n=1 Tax=Frankia nepalensis TaxID=1836974 RepID=UPI001933753C
RGGGGGGRGGGGGGGPPPGGAPPPPAARVAGPGLVAPRAPAMPPAWDTPDPELVRALAGELADPADPYAAGLPGAGGLAAPPGHDPGAGRHPESGYPGVGYLGGGGPVSFDAGLLGALAGRLRTAGVTAGPLAVAVGRADEQALGAVLRAVTAAARATGGGLAQAAGAGAGPAHRFRVAGLPADTDVLRLGLHAVAWGAPGLAASIERRMAHFAAAEEAVRAGGVLIDQRAWFDDAPPPSLAEIRAVAGGLVAFVGDDAGALSAADVREVGRRLAALPPAARAAVISRLRGRPLRVLAGAVDRLTDGLAARSGDELVALAAVPDLLLASAPAPMIAELVRLLPDLEPAPPGAGRRGGAGGGGEADRADPLVRDGVSTSDVGQGGVGDCYLAAALIGLAETRPDLLLGGMRENANGTFTVTLYRDGRAFPVTVTRALPSLAAPGGEDGGAGAGGGWPPVAMAAVDLAGRPELWAAVYEKAYARAHGGYDAINGGDPGVAASDLTGREHHTLPPAVVTVEDLTARLAAGDLITVSTRAHPEPRPGTGLVGRHAFAVLGADPVGGRVLLRNPWASPGEELTRWYRWDDLRPGLRAVTMTPLS